MKFLLILISLILVSCSKTELERCIEVNEEKILNLEYVPNEISDLQLIVSDIWFKKMKSSEVADFYPPDISIEELRKRTLKHFSGDFDDNWNEFLDYVEYREEYRKQFKDTPEIELWEQLIQNTLKGNKKKIRKLSTSFCNAQGIY